MTFDCSKCGACCRKVNCVHITDDNLCSIYDTRPVECDVEKGYEVFFAAHMSKEDYYRENKRICIVLQQEK